MWLLMMVVCRRLCGCVGELVCVAGQWRCDDELTCISEQLVCNGERDCFDGSDELACGPSRHFQPSLSPAIFSWGL